MCQIVENGFKLEKKDENILEEKAFLCSAYDVFAQQSIGVIDADYVETRLTDSMILRQKRHF